MRTASTYSAQTVRLLALMRAVAGGNHTPATLIKHLGVSQPTLYRMLNEVATFGARIEWNGRAGAYRMRDWGILSRARVMRQPSP